MAFLWLSLGASAHATLQPPVTVGSTEWLQPLDFLGYTWNDINSVCNSTTGVCSGSLGGNDLTGWTWARVDDVNALFNYYIPGGTLGPGPDLATGGPFSDWLTPMLDDGFLVTGTGNDSIQYELIQGSVRTSYDSQKAYYAFMAVSNSIGGGFFDNADAYTSLTHDKTYVDTIGGGWFVRGDTSTISVPITDTLALLALGLCALGFTTRKSNIPLI